MESASAAHCTSAQQARVKAEYFSFSSSFSSPAVSSVSATPSLKLSGLASVAASQQSSRGVPGQTKSPRPHSARPPQPTQQGKQVLKTIYTALTHRTARSPLLSSSSKRALQQLCVLKEREMQDLLESSRQLTPLQRATREKLRILNKEKEAKTQRILTQRHHAELDRIKQSQALLKQNSRLLAAKQQEKQARKENLEHSLLRDSIKKAETSARHEDEQLFKANITNYFNDRMQILRECISNTQQALHLQRLEQATSATTATRLRLRLLRHGN